MLKVYGENVLKVDTIKSAVSFQVADCDYGFGLVTSRAWSMIVSGGLALIVNIGKVQECTLLHLTAPYCTTPGISLSALSTWFLAHLVHFNTKQIFVKLIFFVFFFLP